jgi:hypothetical protein
MRDVFAMLPITLLPMISWMMVKVVFVKRLRILSKMCPVIAFAMLRTTTKPALMIAFA